MYFTAHLRSCGQYVSVGDMATIPVGEPDSHIFTGKSGPNLSMVSVDGLQLLSIDHDLRIHGIVHVLSLASFHTCT